MKNFLLPISTDTCIGELSSPLQSRMVTFRQATLGVMADPWTAPTNKNNENIKNILFV